MAAPGSSHVDPRDWLPGDQLAAHGPIQGVLEAARQGVGEFRVLNNSASA